jgi:uncharacterized protein with GYD domain
MQTFVMFGRYTAEGTKGISAARTAKAVDVIKKCGGEVKSIYGLLGKSDVLLVAELPGVKEAMKASIGLSKLTGLTLTTSPAVAVEEFDKLASQP